MEPIIFSYKSESDYLLESWGYNLLEEYLHIFQAAGIPENETVFDAATGSGRAVSILARSCSKIVTADYSFERKSEAEKRISTEHLNKVKFLRLNLEHIPFESNSFATVVCMNTVHELDSPLACLDELIRIVSPKGKLVIADFNPEGLDVMDRLHEVRYGGRHPRGKLSIDKIKDLLSSEFSSVKEIPTRLNMAYIAEKKTA